MVCYLLQCVPILVVLVFVVGQAVPEIPLSVGSKLELLRAFVFAKFPYTCTSPYTHAFVRVSDHCVFSLLLLAAKPDP